MSRYKLVRFIPDRFNPKVELPLAIICIVCSGLAGWLLAGHTAMVP